MWVRGRTVLALMVLAAVASGITTYAALRNPGFLAIESPGRNEPASASPGHGINEKELEKFNKAFELIREKFLLASDRDRLLDGAIQGMVEALSDPYSVYKTAEDSEAFTDELQGAFTGIGANLTLVKGNVVVESTIKGTPAERAGLQPKDVLISINGESLRGLTLTEAVAKIRGPKGTKAKLSVQREGFSEPLDLELVRDRIDLVTVHAEMAEHGIGYLVIHKFTFDTARSVAEELALLEQQGLKALVIDVRDNPGGTVQAVEEIVAQFVEKGKPIMQFEYRDGKVKTDYAEQGLAEAKPYPIVVLMNKESASAAEILAGALQQSADALLVGERTYGKGTVQVSYEDELGDGSLMKLTVYKWLLPNGVWVNETGIPPNVTVSQPRYYYATQLPRGTAMKLDDTGEQVENLQLILEGVGFPADRTDGYFSTGTEEALKRFQRQEGLPETGAIDDATAVRLEEALYERLQQKEYDKQWLEALKLARERIGSGS